jgi:hypothetical protein
MALWQLFAWLLLCFGAVFAIDRLSPARINRGTEIERLRHTLSSAGRNVYLHQASLMQPAGLFVVVFPTHAQFEG